MSLSTTLSTVSDTVTPPCVSHERDDKSYNEWKLKAKVQLQSKIEDNYIQRANKSVTVINAVIKQYIPNKPLPPFKLSPTAIGRSLEQLFQKVASWRGVDSRLTHYTLVSFNEYFLRADNWWNRYKAEWIGDFFFYPLFSQDIQQYLSSNGIAHTDLLHLMIIQHILSTEIRFRRSKSQPLLLDQCYRKSQLLRRLFVDLGKTYSVPWNLPANDKELKDYRNIIRKYAQDWIDSLITTVLTTMGVNDINTIAFNDTPLFLPDPFVPNQQNESCDDVYVVPTPQLPDRYCECAHPIRCRSCFGVVPPYRMDKEDVSYTSASTPYKPITISHVFNNNNNRPVSSFRYEPYQTNDFSLQHDPQRSQSDAYSQALSALNTWINSVQYMGLDNS